MFKTEFRKWEHLMAGGAAATMILTLLMYVAPAFGLPPIDMAAAIGMRITGYAVLPLTVAWWAGLAIFFAVGTVVSPIILFYSLPALFGSPWQRGMEWGVLVWVFGGVWAMFFLGLAYNAPHFNHPAMSFAASLAGHLVYGLVLGVVGIGTLPRTQSA
jgi:Family of unknown function (DUF6789)